MVEGPLIQKYLKALEDNPRSRVFAPLAESYRRLGMTDRSIDILKDGMRYHPNYVVGYLGLAACYFDLGQFQLCYSTLKPFVPTSRDNLRLQRLFAETCERVGHDYEALETYKFLLFLNPKDKDAAERVAILEAKSDQGEVFSNSQKTDLFPVEDLKSSEDLEEVSWVEVNFHKQADGPQQNPQDSWEMVGAQKVTDNGPEFHTSIVATEVNQEKYLAQADAQYNDKERDYVVVKPAAELKEDVGQESDQTKEHQVPLITHTLVDLYCNQGHFERAEEILLKMLALNPSDGPTLEKLQTVRLLLREVGLGEHEEDAEEVSVTSEAAEEDGHQKLMQVFDSRVAKKGGSEGKIRGLNIFLDKIKNRAQQRNTSTTRS